MITLENIESLTAEALTAEEFRELVALAIKGLETQKALRDFDKRFGPPCDEGPPYTTQFG